MSLFVKIAGHIVTIPLFVGKIILTQVENRPVTTLKSKAKIKTVSDRDVRDVMALSATMQVGCTLGQATRSMKKC
jgi:hypothetical protein